MISYVPPQHVWNIVDCTRSCCSERPWITTAAIVLYQWSYLIFASVDAVLVLSVA